MNTAIQTNIKKQLSAKNMTAAELERRTGIPHAVVNILHGRSKNPSLKTAQAIAKELGCSVEELLAEESKSISDANWHPKIYQDAFSAVYTCVQTLGLQPKAQQVSACVTEVYVYTLGGNSEVVDQRFVQWLVQKNLGTEQTSSQF